MANERTQVTYSSLQDYSLNLDAGALALVTAPGH